MPAGSTYTPIATQTLGSAAASVNFTSISGTYTDLILIFSVSNTAGTPTARLQFNGDTSTNYSTTILYGDGSTGGSVRVSNESSANICGTANDFGTTEVHLNSYSNTSIYKTAISYYGFIGSYSETGSKMCLWRSTAAISSILIFPLSSTFVAGSTFSLYGIKAA